MSLSSKNKISIQFSMASMTDVVFLMLIFFMITSTMVHSNALKLLLPESKTQTSERPNATVSITGELRFYVENTPVDVSEVEALLKQKLQNNPNPTISIYAERSVPINEVVKIMDIARRNNYKAILATTSE